TGPQRLAAWVSDAPQVTVIGPLTNDGDPGLVCKPPDIAGSQVGTKTTIDTAAGPLEWHKAGVGGALGSIVPVQVVRYQIARDADQVPNLWRSATGGRSQVDGYAAVANPPGAAWQMVARGIEDMQVQYTDGTGGGLDQPQAIDPAAAPPQWDR